MYVPWISQIVFFLEIAENMLASELVLKQAMTPQGSVFNEHGYLKYAGAD